MDNDVPDDGQSVVKVKEILDNGRFLLYDTY